MFPLWYVVGPGCGLWSWRAAEFEDGPAVRRAESGPGRAYRGRNRRDGPIGPGHAACVGRLNALLVPPVGGRAVVRVQNPVHLGGRWEPRPDLALARPRADYYAGGHPGPDDILLLIEVAETRAD